MLAAILQKQNINCKMSIAKTVFSFSLEHEIKIFDAKKMT